MSWKRTTGNDRETELELMCNGRILWKIDENGIRTDYAYDTARQLVEASRSPVLVDETIITPEPITSFIQDAAGQPPQIRRDMGAMTTRKNTEHDLLGRITSSTDALGRVTTCAYSEDGLTTTRAILSGATFVTRSAPDETVTSHERYLYRDCLQLTALDMLDNRNVLRILLWDPLEPVATRPLALVQDNVCYCYGTDFNKNVAEIFEGQGAMAVSYDYSPYGQVASTGSLIQRVQWSSEMNEGELALVYYNYRYYNPADGRWINRDPLTEE